MPLVRTSIAEEQQLPFGASPPARLHMNQQQVFASPAACLPARTYAYTPT